MLSYKALLNQTQLPVAFCTIMSELQPKKKIKLENSKMETFILRFPTVTQNILQELDDQNLTKCREVGLSFHKFLNQDKVLWLRMIQNYSENYGNYKKLWNLVMKQVPVDIFKKLALCVESFLNEGSFKLPFSLSPLHVAVYSGNFAICKYIEEKTKNFNSENCHDVTPLHIAARYGYLDIYKFISKGVQDKNPECITRMDTTYTKLTPLHLAAMYGNLDIYKFIYENVDEKNPIGNIVYNNTVLPLLTPLYVAATRNQIGVLKFILDKNTPISDVTLLLKLLAQTGMFEAFKLIFERTDEKNPADDYGMTPFHFAAKMGHFDIYKLIFDHLDDKNPRDGNGRTPLHAAVKDIYHPGLQSIIKSEDHIKIFKFNFENGNDVNPSDYEGNTVLHEIAKELSKTKLKVQNGLSILDYTKFEKNAKEIVKFIKESIQDKYPKNNNSMSPSDLASDPVIFSIFAWL